MYQIGWNTFELIIDTVSLGISERGVEDCSASFSSLHFSTLEIFRLTTEDLIPILTSAIFFSSCSSSFSLNSFSSSAAFSFFSLKAK